MVLRVLTNLVALAAAVAADQSATAPVVLELFTSEGCSSCPPADALLAKLHRSGSINGIDVIVLSEHVDYWNRLGWVDPFSSGQFSKRQRSYSSNWPDRMYTPQMVIDGAIEVLGSDPLAVNRGVIVASLAKKASISLDAKFKGHGRIDLTVGIAEIPEGDWTKLDVYAVVIEDDISIDVTRGENRGRVLKHVGVVRKLEQLGQFSSDERAPVRGRERTLPGRLLDFFVRSAVAICFSRDCGPVVGTCRLEGLQGAPKARLGLFFGRFPASGGF